MSQITNTCSTEQHSVQHTDVSTALSWQMVHDDEELYSVQSMAELLFGNADASSCYASHRLLSQERTFFKQASRSPPLFQARSPKDVNALRMKQAAEEQVLTTLD